MRLRFLTLSFGAALLAASLAAPAVPSVAAMVAGIAGEVTVGDLSDPGYALLEVAGGPGLVTLEAACQPAELGAVALRGVGLAPGEAWADDRGFVVEQWVGAVGDPPDGRAIVLLLRAEGGGQVRCLALARTPPGQPS